MAHLGFSQGLELKMGTITKSTDGGLQVNFNKAHFVNAEEEIFRYGVASFSYLIPRGKTIYLSDFIALINQHYAGDVRVELVNKVIEKAKILQKFLCTFSFYDDANNAVTQTAKVDAENWHQVKDVVQAHVQREIFGLEIQAGCHTYVRGNLYYSPLRNEVVNVC